jgi:cardiolipin synthase
VVEDVEADFAETLKECQRITLKHCRELPFYMKVFGRALRLIAPLM